MTDHNTGNERSLPHRIPAGLLNREFPPHLVDEAVRHSRTPQKRSRLLSQQLMTYFTMAMWLYSGHAYTDVARHLVEGLGWARGGPDAEIAWPAVTDGALSRARERLGPGPLRVLFSHSTADGPDTSAALGTWRGRRVVALDTFWPDMPKTAANAAVFGMSPNSADPAVQLTALADCRSRRLLAAVMDVRPPADDRAVCSLLRLGPGFVVLTGSRHAGLRFVTAAVAAQTPLLCGAPAGYGLPIAKWLSDGTYLSTVPGPGSEPITVRVVDHGLGGPAGRLVTTLLEPSTAPASELVEHYTARWQTDQLTRMLLTSHRTTLRSRHPWGVEQEVWAMLCAYQAISHLIHV